MQSRIKPLAALLPLLSTPVLHAEQLRSLDPVVVTASRQQQHVSEVIADITVIESDEIRKAGPTTSLGELLGRQPGIEFKQNAGPGQVSSIFIRGSNDSHVLLLVDGIRVGSATLGTPSWEFLPLEQIDHIEILRGPASSLYGSDAIGGVVQIFTKRGDGPPRVFVEAGYGTYNTAALSTGVSGGQDGWRYSLQVSNKRSSAFSATSYNPDKDNYLNTSSSGNLSYTVSGNNEFGINYLYSDGWNRYDSAFSAANDYKRKMTISTVTAYSRTRLTDIWTSTVRIGQGTDNSRQNFGDGRFKTDQTQYQWQNDVKLPVGSALLGAERVEQRVSSDTAYDLTRRTIDSFYAGWTGRIARHYLQLNARQDRNSQFGEKVTGVAAYGYQLNNHWRSNLSLGTAFKAPTFNDLYFPLDAYGDVGNPNLKPESSENREASLHYETDSLHTSVTYYQNDVKNLIQWAPDASGNNYMPQNLANARLSGWTLAHSQKLGDYRISASLDLQDPKDSATNKTLIFRAREIGKLAVSREFGAWNVGTEVQASGQRYSDTANTNAMGGYALVNLTANYQVSKDWSLFARANNLLDKKYVMVPNYATPGANVFVGVRYAPR